MNALVSFLSQAATVMLLSAVSTALGQLKWKGYLSRHKLTDIEALDGASRGPEGSIKLFWVALTDRRCDYAL
jgi:hypothetical protein